MSEDITEDEIPDISVASYHSAARDDRVDLSGDDSASVHSSDEG